MTDDHKEKPEAASLSKTLKENWGSEKLPALFAPEELDIVVNEEKGEVWIFHGKPLPAIIENIEYDHKGKTITFITEDGRKFDLGVKIQWLVRATINKAEHIFVMHTKDREPQGWFICPLTHVNAEQSDANEEEK